jgi:zinc/manganese transport system ATP-binding protein
LDEFDPGCCKNGAGVNTNISAAPLTEPPAHPDSTPVLSLIDAGLAYGSTTLWSHVDLQVRPGEFVAVLGANGSGKTSLLKVILGLVPLTHGEITVVGHAPHRGSSAIGYVPQQRRVDPIAPVRARDLVRLGTVGHRWGLSLPRHSERRMIDAALDAVGALSYADRPVGQLSGGEQQRIRIAQAIATDPALLLCDEPLLSLDLNHQSLVTQLVDRRRREHGTAVLFVTHEINPVLQYVDRVLYLAGGRFRIGPVEEVMTPKTLSELYGTPIDVIRRNDRIVVLGLPDHVTDPHHDHLDA